MRQRRRLVEPRRRLQRDHGIGVATGVDQLLRGGAASDAPSCRVCKDTGFIEVLGCGMIHPVVFEHVGYDAERYTGFAFGLGIDRVAMLRYGIPHLNLLYGNDPRFLNQF